MKNIQFKTSFVFALLFIGMQVLAQSSTAVGPLLSESNSTQRNTINLQSFPGQVFDSYFYFWNASSSALSYLPSIANGNEWIAETSFFPESSSSCNDPITLKLTIETPLEDGVYLGEVVDLTGNFGVLNIELTVTSNPTPDFTLPFQAVVNQTLNIPEQVTYNGLTGIGCVESFFPGSAQTVKNVIHPPVAWASINPEEFTLSSGEQQLLTNTLQSAQAGVFESFLYRYRTYSTLPSIVKVIFTVNESTGIYSSPALGLQMDKPIYNPENQLLQLHLTSESRNNIRFSIYDLQGRMLQEIETYMVAGEQTINLQLNKTNSGLYILKPQIGSTPLQGIKFTIVN